MMPVRFLLGAILLTVSTAGSGARTADCTTAQDAICINLVGLPEDSKVTLERVPPNIDTGTAIAKVVDGNNGKIVILERDTKRWAHEITIRIARYGLPDALVEKYNTDITFELYFGAMSKYWRHPFVIYADQLQQSGMSDSDARVRETITKNRSSPQEELYKAYFRTKQQYDWLTNLRNRHPSANNVEDFHRRIGLLLYEFAVRLAEYGLDENETVFQMIPDVVAASLIAKNDAEFKKEIENKLLRFREFRLSTLYDALPTNQRIVGGKLSLEQRCDGARIAWKEFRDLFEKSEAWLNAYKWRLGKGSLNEGPYRDLADSIKTHCSCADINGRWENTYWKGNKGIAPDLILEQTDCGFEGKQTSNDHTHSIKGDWVVNERRFRVTSVRETSLDNKKDRARAKEDEDYAGCKVDLVGHYSMNPASELTASSEPVNNGKCGVKGKQEQIFRRSSR